MLTLPEWDLEFARRSRRYTRMINAYELGRVLVIPAIPWLLAAAVPFGFRLGERPFRAIVLFFVLLLISLAAEQIVRGLCRRQKRRAVSALFRAMPELVLLCALSSYWWLLFPGHVALAVGAWWAFGVFLALWRYVWRRWALKEAALKTKDYRLYGHRIGRSIRRVKHDKAWLYELPKDSAFGPRAIMALVSGVPEVFVSEEAGALLDADQLRTAIAHELGHSWSQRHVACEVADWVRRMFFVPLAVWFASALLAAAPARIEPVLVFVFLTVLTLIWQVNRWVLYLLGRPQELAADLYAVEMTHTPEAFFECMRRLGEVSRYNVFPNLFDTLGFCSHPCTVKRLRYVAAALEAGTDGSDAEKRPHKRRRR